jgi:ribosomal protein L37AE/L43A
MDFTDETGVYVAIEYNHKFYQFVMCPFCKELQMITGKTKKHKVWICWNCDSHFIEPGKGNFES